MDAGHKRGAPYRPFGTETWLMNHEHITLEIEHITLEVDHSTRARLQFQLPPDATDDEIAYFETLTPRVENGLLEMVDPETWAVVFRCRPTLLN